MIGVWYTEGPLYVDDDGTYYGITINNKIINRYLEYADKIYILTRIRKIRPEIKNATKIKLNNIEIVEIPNCSSFKGIIKNYNKVKRYIKEYLEISDFAIIGLPSIIGNIATTVCKKYKKKYIVEMLACPWDSLWNHGKITGKLMAPIQYFLTKQKVREAQNVIYVSNEFLQKRYPNNKNSIGCSDVILEEYHEDVLEKRINKIEKYNNNHTYKLGLIGSLDLQYKGHKTAIQALSILLKKYNVELHFLGKGEKSKWKKFAENMKVSNNIKFDGTLPAGKPVYQWIDNMDIFLIPSLQEGLPRALIEAMSRGCPAVGVKTGGIPELLSEEFVANRKDFKTVAYMIEKMLNSKDIMKQQAKLNFSKAGEFKKDDLYQKRKEYYGKIISD